MWIDIFSNRVDTPFGVKLQKCVKVLDVFITYDVQLLVKKLKKVTNTIRLWKIWGLFMGKSISLSLFFSRK